MSYLIDSHTHLHDREFFPNQQAEDMLARARKNNVLQVICIGTSRADSLAAKSFAESHPDVFWTYGVHPEEAGKDTAGFPQELKANNLPHNLVAIGEVGLDYHYPDYDKSAQWRLLEEMLDLAVNIGLPCSFHVRDALPDFFSIVKNFPNLKPSVLHSFSDSKQNLETALSSGFYIGVNGLATFANLECYKTLTPDFLDHCVLETDAPFLTPAPKRGKINESGYIKYIAEFLANKLGVSADLVAEKTTKNVRIIFNLPNPREETA